ncbi:hypothetical protein BKA69DRAFT_880500 [Paraphysoderma sedebokerense]|nr:hypothetical protein BKA69DRAFT_880500 [Paraphysoderma sedebokerense]
MDLMEIATRYQPSRGYYLDDSDDVDYTTESPSAQLIDPTTQAKFSFSTAASKPIHCDVLIIGFDVASVYLNEVARDNENCKVIGHIEVESVKPYDIPSSFSKSTHSLSISSLPSSQNQEMMNTVILPVVAQNIAPERAVAIVQSLFENIIPQKVIVLSALPLSDLKITSDDIDKIETCNLFQLVSGNAKPYPSYPILPAPNFVDSLCEMFSITANAFFMMLPTEFGSVQYRPTTLASLRQLLKQTQLEDIVLPEEKNDMIIQDTYKLVLGKSMETSLGNPLYL